jgi:hypothetical protein
VRVPPTVARSWDGPSSMGRAVSDLNNHHRDTLEKMLREAGLSPDGAAERADERTRDFGDSRWGEPA